MRTIDPNSLKGRLIVSGIEKLGFTLLLLLILAVWTGQQREFERENVRAERVHDIEIDRPIALVEQLADPVRECLLFIRMNRIGGISGGGGRREQVQTELQSLLVEIELQADMIEKYTRNSKKETSAAARKLAETVRDFGRKVNTETIVELDDYNAFMKQLADQFGSLFDATISETVAAISGSAQGEFQPAPVGGSR